MRAPHPRRWLATDETERLDQILRYHRRIGVDLPNERIHALFHLIVENQAALRGETPVAAALERLCGEGLDRHEALHAVGSVLAKYFWEAFQPAEKGPRPAPDAYFDEVAGLTAKQWLDSFEE